MATTWTSSIDIRARSLAHPYDWVRTGRSADALELERHQLARTPSRGRYARLRAVTEPVGCWPDERADADRVVRQQVAATEATIIDAQRRNAWWQPPGSLLVALLLDNGAEGMAVRDAPVGLGKVRAGVWESFYDGHTDAFASILATVHRRPAFAW